MTNPIPMDKFLQRLRGAGKDQDRLALAMVRLVVADYQAGDTGTPENALHEIANIILAIEQIEQENYSDLEATLAAIQAERRLA